MRQYSGLERLEAALLEMGRGMTYAATPNFEPAVLAALERAKAPRPRLVPSLRVITPRLIVIMTVALALLACAAVAAYYVSTQTWLSSGPRGVQFTNDFELVELLRLDQPAPLQYVQFSIGPDGHDIYALRRPWEPAVASVVRLYGLQQEQPQAEVVLNFSDLIDPELWDPGVQLSGSVITAAPFNAGDDSLSVAANGDLFLVASAWRRAVGTGLGEEYAKELQRRALRGLQIEEVEQLFYGASLLGTSLIVIHADGSRQKVLSIRELVTAGLLDTEGAERVSIAVAASAPDRLWIRTQTLTPRLPIGTINFYEVQDPDADGDWSDRTVRPLSLPASFPRALGADGYADWFFHQMATEPSLGGDDRSRSFLLAMVGRAAEYRIYRISDVDGDGDALDAGELKLLFTGVLHQLPPSPSGPAMAPRAVVTDGMVVLREFLVGSITGPTRISRISETGELTDIARFRLH